MRRSIRIVALFGVMVGTFYFFTLLPWFGRLSEETVQETQMAASAPIHMAVPSPRVRETVRPEAEEDFDGSCQPGAQDPNCVPKELNRVTDLIEAGRREEARDLLFEMLKARPDNVNTMNTLGLLYRHRFDDPEQAALYFQKALTINSDRRDIAGGLSEIYYETGDFAEGIRVFRQLDSRHPKNAAIKLMLGSFEFQDGDDDRAIEQLSQALKLDPDLLGGYHTLADAQASAGQNRQAYRTLKRLLRRHLEQKKELTELGEPTVDLDRDIFYVQQRLNELSVE